MSLKNIIVIGGSYIGARLAESLAVKSQSGFRVLLIEKNSHFQHIFAFPRYAVTNAAPTHKAFIPYKASRLGQDGAVIQAGVSGLTRTAALLDREVLLDGEWVRSIPFSALAIATGTSQTPPSTLPTSQKSDGTSYLRQHASQVEKALRIVLIGAGAVGVQMAVDIKQLFPGKSVTLIHSRERVMNRFHHDLHSIVSKRCEELGIDMILGERVSLPDEGYPTDGSACTVKLRNGTEIVADLVIKCTGQTPNSDLLRSLAPDAIDAEGYVKVLDTLQIADKSLPNIFSLGDVAATGAPKAARPALAQAELVSDNIKHLLESEVLETYKFEDAPAIHLTLGIEKSVIFRNPLGSSDPPVIMHKNDGMDMGIDGLWARRGVDLSEATM